MPATLAALLRKTVDKELPYLRALPEKLAAVKSKIEYSWSPKQELGHLIDSASNNHIRFVRAALEPAFRGPGYAQDDWVLIHGYQEMPWSTIVDFWSAYNYFLATLLEKIPAVQLSTPCTIGESSPQTLGFVIEDYILHMQHHLDHLLKRAEITRYPSAPNMAGTTI